mmetsp:Transcript_23281/g.79225  ORF Transcript_23281/g.79225 Transcript_23281/m.79225 type:complete len:421 (-) Transcript_23281:82-1344(-)
MALTRCPRVPGTRAGPRARRAARRVVTRVRADGERPPVEPTAEASVSGDEKKNGRAAKGADDTAAAVGTPPGGVQGLTELAAALRDHGITARAQTALEETRAAAQRAAESISKVATEVRDYAYEDDDALDAGAEGEDRPATTKRRVRQGVKLVGGAYAWLAQRLAALGELVRELVADPDRLMERCEEAWADPSFVAMRERLVSSAWVRQAPAVAAVVAAQVWLFVNTATLPTLLPVVIASGFICKVVLSNLGSILWGAASLGLVAWGAWFADHIACATVRSIEEEGGIGAEGADRLVRGSKVACALVGTAGAASALGVGVAPVLLPALAVAALAAKDVLWNVSAGLLVHHVERPFGVGSRLRVRAGGKDEEAEWFEGDVTGVDLRFVELTEGDRRMMVPNAVLMQREFVLVGGGESTTPA